MPPPKQAKGIIAAFRSHGASGCGKLSIHQFLPPAQWLLLTGHAAPAARSRLPWSAWHTPSPEGPRPLLKGGRTEEAPRSGEQGHREQPDYDF